MLSNEVTVVEKSGIVEFSDSDGDEQKDEAVLQATILPTQIPPPCKMNPVILDLPSPEHVNAKCHGVAIGLNHDDNNSKITKEEQLLMDNSSRLNGCVLKVDENEKY